MGKLAALRGSIFRLRNLHPDGLTGIDVQRSEAGAMSSAQSTAAHLPSLYYWLQVRGGISFSETQALSKAGRLLWNGKAITGDEVLLKQTPWQELANENIKVVNTKGRAVDPQHRALHRQYFFVFNSKGLDIVNSVENPLSFCHALPNTDPASMSSYTVLRASGSLRTMRGLWLATNDVQIKPLWQAEALGNYGVYSIRFYAGCPDDGIEAVRQRLEKEFSLIAPQLPKDSKAPFSVKVCDLDETFPDMIARMDSRPLHRGKHILVSTPRFPISVATKMRSYIANIFVLKNGPFDCRAECEYAEAMPNACPLSHTAKPLWSSFLKDPAADGDNAIALEALKKDHHEKMKMQDSSVKSSINQPQGSHIAPLWTSKFNVARSLNRQELVQLYTFERKMKTNKVILGLRELQGVGASGDVGDEDLYESMKLCDNITPI